MVFTSAAAAVAAAAAMAAAHAPIAGTAAGPSHLTPDLTRIRDNLVGPSGRSHSPRDGIQSRLPSHSDFGISQGMNSFSRRQIDSIRVSESRDLPRHWSGTWLTAL